MPQRHVIATAYSCEPNKGSEPGIGWNIVREAARYHRLCVITRENNEPAITAELEKDPALNLRFVYYDLPKWARWWKRGTRGLQLYYYLWQIGAYRLAKRLHAQTPFDVTHHVTFGRYWNPSFLPLLDLPFVWGPVGGGESAPKPFWPAFGFKGRVYESLRNIARWIGELDPFVRMTARKSHTALATTAETRDRLVHLGARHVEYLGNAALNQKEVARFGELPAPSDHPVRFVSIGRLLHWKGFNLGLDAFAQAQIPDAEYWMIGDGPARAALEQQAAALGLADRVRFWGTLSRDETLARLGTCHALVHPSLHDSGGWVCIEAMAAGRPVICLDLGGPAVLVDDRNGWKVTAEGPEPATAALKAAMQAVAADVPGCLARGQQACTDAAERFTWEAKGKQIAHAYEKTSAPVYHGNDILVDHPT